MTMTALSPALRARPVQPLRISALGLPPSIFHATSLPFGSGTIRSIQMCGFVHLKSLIVPINVTLLFWSKRANEWWAAAGAAVSTAVTIPHSSVVLATRKAGSPLEDLDVSDKTQSPDGFVMRLLRAMF